MGEPSTPAAALRLIGRGLLGASTGASPRSASSSGPVGPRRRTAVERNGIRVEPRAVAAYLRATAGVAATQDAPAAGSPLPPLYPSVWETALLLELLGTGEVPFPRRGLVHLGGETVQVRAVTVGEPMRCRVELEAVEPVRGGTRLTALCRTWDRRSRLCTEDRIVLLARTGSTGGGRTTSGRARDDADPQRVWQTLAEWELGSGDGRRYARASGDYNPIHLWSWSARPFGFDRPILQGFCTEAKVAHALVTLRLGGDWSALRRIDISFRAPLSLPGRARLLISPHGGGGRYRVIADGASTTAAEGSWVAQG